MLDKIFTFFVKHRNKKYDFHKKKIFKCSIPVISIGNLSTGGTGKTPVVIFICKKLLESGKKPAVIGRGYKRNSSGTVIVSDGKNILVDAKIAGDEMFLISQKVKVPVVVSNKKYQAALAAEKLFDIDCIVVDDGFQHRQLHRNYDIVLIDNKTLAKPYLLPKGRLREPFEALTRANLVCLTKNATEEEFKKIYKNQIPIIKSKFIFGTPYELFNTNFDDSNSSNKNNNLYIQDNKINGTLNSSGAWRFIAVAGIANPKNFFDMIIENNLILATTVIFNDHHNYTINSIHKIAEISAAYNCTNIAITEKDAVKLIQFKDEIQKHKLLFFVFPVEMILENFEIPDLW